MTKTVWMRRLHFPNYFFSRYFFCAKKTKVAKKESFICRHRWKREGKRKGESHKKRLFLSPSPSFLSVRAIIIWGKKAAGEGGEGRRGGTITNVMTAEEAEEETEASFLCFFPFFFLLGRESSKHPFFSPRGASEKERAFLCLLRLPLDWDSPNCSSVHMFKLREERQNVFLITAPTDINW